MLPNLEFLKDKITQTYSWLSDYYYGPTQTFEDVQKLSPQDRVMAIRKVLKSECIYSEQVQGKIEMQYSKVVQCLNYKKFYYTTQLPSEHPVPQQQLQKQLICIFGQYNLKTEKIKCPLVIQILFEESFPSTLPKFYIKTPKFPQDPDSFMKMLRTARPNRMVVDVVGKKVYKPSEKYKFKARTDGVEVIFPQRSNDWKMDVKALLDECIEMIKSEFPFVKMKQPVILADIEGNMDAQTKVIYDKSKKIRDILIQSNEKRIKKSQNAQIQSQLPSFVQMTQNLDILSRSIDAEDKLLKEENYKMEKSIREAEKFAQETAKVGNFRKFYPEISKDPLQKQLFELIVEHQSAKDCLVEVQRIVKYENSLDQEQMSNSELKKVMGAWQSINQTIFYQRYKINQIVSQIKSNEAKNLSS